MGAALPFEAYTLAAATVDRLSLLAAVAGAAAVLFASFRHSARWAACIWLVTVTFVPYWLGIKVLINLSPGSAIGILVLFSLVPVFPKRIHVADLLFSFLLLLAVLPIAVGAGTLTTVFLAVGEWGAGFLLGRLLPLTVGLDWLYDAVATVFSVVGAFALLEFFTGWNPFVKLTFGNPSWVLWTRLQDRGGVTRAEWAFGHSIALGACLALAVPLVIACRLPTWLRSTMLLLVTGGTVVTFSRLAIGSALLAAILSVVALRTLSTRMRIGVLVGGVLVGLIASSSVLSVFTEAGSEATDSSGYRLALTSLIPDFAFVGLSPAARVNEAGTLYFGSFRSIDSAVVLIGLTYGLAAVGVVLALYLGAVGLLLRGRATPPVVALIAQLPALLSVALITQYTIVFWFFVGLAVTAQTQASRCGTPGDESRGRKRASSGRVPARLPVS